MFVSEFGKNQNASVFAGTTLVIPSHAVGLSPHIGMDLFILNEGMTKHGFYKSDHISPMVMNDVLSVNGQAAG